MIASKSPCPSCIKQNKKAGIDTGIHTLFRFTGCGPSGSILEEIIQNTKIIISHKSLKLISQYI